MQFKKLRLVLGLTRHPHQQAIAQVPLFQVYALLCLWILGRKLSKSVCEAMQQEKSVSTQRFTVMISSACWHLHRASITIKLLGLATQHCLQDKPTEQELELAQVTTCLAPVCARSQAIATCQSLSCRCRGRQVFEQYSHIFCDNTEVSSAARTASRFSFSLWSAALSYSWTLIFIDITTQGQALSKWELAAVAMSLRSKRMSPELQTAYKPESIRHTCPSIHNSILYSQP